MITLLIKIVVVSAILGVVVAYCWAEAKKEDSRKNDWLGDDIDD